MKLKSKRLITSHWAPRRKLLASAIGVALMTASWVPVAEAVNIQNIFCRINWFGWSCPNPVYIPPAPQINPTPQVNAGSNLDVEVGQQVDFNGSFTDGDKDGPYTYTWTFGDGNSTTGTVSQVGSIPVNHTYTQAGQLTATLEVTDRSGKKGSRQITVKVVAVSDDTCSSAVITIRSKKPVGMWNIPTTWDKNRLPNANDWVLIQPSNTVILPNAPVNVKGLCIEQGGVLQSAFNNLLSPTTAVDLSAGAIRNRGTIQSSAGVNSGLVGNDYKHATAGSDIRITTGRFVNETTGKISASGRGGDDLPYNFYVAGSGVVDAIGGNGGNIDIQTEAFINQGTVESGNGGDGDTFDSWSKFVYGNAYGGKGGSVKINASNLAMSMNGPTGKIKAGNGGLADGIYRWLQLNLVYSWNPWWGWYIATGWWNSGKMYNVVGGTGGSVSVNLGNISGVIQGSKGQEIRRDLRYSNVIWIEPTTLTMDETTRVNDADQIIIFGGDDWTMDLRKLSPGAIQADQVVTLAVGNNSTIDLRGVTGKVFVAAEKVEIFADNVMLDPGVTLQDLAEAPEVVQQPSKILYHVELNHAETVVGEPNATLPVQLSVLNNGPTEDTYTVTLSDNQSWQMMPPPEQVTVGGLRRTDLTFEVTLPSARGAQDELTVTVTSQNDPTATATATLRVGVKEAELITPRTGQQADMTIVVNNSVTMAGLFQTVADALEKFLAEQPVNSPSDKEMVNFLTQFNEDNPPTKEAVEGYLATFKTEPPKLPTIELITFTDNWISRVVTNNLADLIGRIRSLQPQDGGECPDATVGTLNYALDNLNDNGQIILATASSAETALDADTQLKLQARGIKTHVLLAGSCDNSEATDKAFYQHLADLTGGTFNWLPQGITADTEVAKVFSEVVSEVVTTTTPSGGAMVSPPHQYQVSGTIQDELGNPLVSATVQVGPHTVTTDATGYWEVKGLPENRYTATVTKTGYGPFTKEFELGNHQDAVMSFKPQSLLDVKVLPSPQPPGQGDDLTYTVTVKNNGKLTATGVILSEAFREGTQLVRLETGDGQCDLTTATCTLNDLSPRATATVTIVVNSPAAQVLENAVIVASMEYPTSAQLTETQIKPYLTVSVQDSSDPVAMQGTLQYTFRVALHEKAPEPATEVQLAVRLPNGVTLNSVNSSQGQCESGKLPLLTCQLDSLNPGEQATVTVSIKLVEMGLLVLTVEATSSASGYVDYLVRERTHLAIPLEAKADIFLLVDTTHSMQEDINATTRALKGFIAQIDPVTATTVALITFKDEVKLEAYTKDLNLLSRMVGRLEAQGGGLCPEASAEALELAIDHLKTGGKIVLITDASPYEDADLEGLSRRLKAQNVNLTAIITGDCSQGGTSLNEVTNR